MTHKFDFEFYSEDETCDFARELSLFLTPGIVLLLEGELGSGKSTFARALISSLLHDNESTEIPSPTYTLMQSFNNTRIPVLHADFYRLKSEQELVELDLEHYASDHILIIEWPTRSVYKIGKGQLVLHFSGKGSHRTISISAAGPAQDLIARLIEVRAFLASAKTPTSKRKFLDGDASSRRYERLMWGITPAILMDMPKRPDGPKVEDGKPYSQIAHLAEGIGAVLAINGHLYAKGFAAPQTYSCDIEKGLAIIEDLQGELFGTRRKNRVSMTEPMQAAIELLAHMTALPWPTKITYPAHNEHNVSPYDLESQLIEVSLLPQWYLSWATNSNLSDEAAQAFKTLWMKTLSELPSDNTVWVLRDFHSPNLIWRGNEEGFKKIGLIDTQDAVLGHPAYDLVSLLQDARLDLEPDEEESLLESYVELRKKQPTFDEAQFRWAYAILGAQRATKILGIFARLFARDGKPAYLQHIPRVRRYLEKNLAHPALSELKTWYSLNLPPAAIDPSK